MVQHADHAVFAAELLQRLGFKVFGQAVRHVDAEAVGAVVGPEAQGLLEFLVDVRVLPVDVRLRLVEQVQIPLAVGHARPGRAAEEGLPVVGRQFAVLAAAVAEDVAVARRGAGLGGEGFLEEHVLVGGVIGHDVHDHLDAGLMRGFGHGVEVVHGAQSRVDVAVVDHVVAAVRQIGGVERGEPDGVHAEALQVVHFLGDAGDVADAVAVNVLEAARVDLVDDGLLPPVVIEVICGHADSLLFRVRCGWVVPVAPELLCEGPTVVLMMITISCESRMQKSIYRRFAVVTWSRLRGRCCRGRRRGGFAQY